MKGWRSQALFGVGLAALAIAIVPFDGGAKGDRALLEKIADVRSSLSRALLERELSRAEAKLAAESAALLASGLSGAATASLEPSVPPELAWAASPPSAAPSTPPPLAASAETAAAQALVTSLESTTAPASAAPAETPPEPAPSAPSTTRAPPALSPAAVAYGKGDAAALATLAKAASDPDKRKAMQAALDYMGLKAGTPIQDTMIDWVFIGSCTNSRMSDLRDAARIARGRKVAGHVRAWVVPGSENIKRQAEAEGLHKVFLDAGFEWREPGCSMCLAVNGDTIQPGQRSVSTSNRNFVGRQGPGGRTHLASPAMAAAAAIAGRIADVRSI